MMIAASAITTTVATMMATFGIFRFFEDLHFSRGAPHRLFPAQAVQETIKLCAQVSLIQVHFSYNLQNIKQSSFIFHYYP